MKRIVIFSIIYHPHPIGGAEVALENIVRRSPDIQWTMITPRFTKDAPRVSVVDGIEVHRVGVGSILDKYLLPLTGALKAWQLHRKQAFDCSWAMMANTAGLAALFFKWLRGVPYVLSLQEGDPESYYWKLTWWWRPLYVQIYKSPRFTQVISSMLEERSRRYGYKGQLQIVPNGVSFETFSRPISETERNTIRQQWQVGDETTVIITTSRLAHKNAVDELIKGFKILRDRGQQDCLLVIAGTGELESELRTLVEKLELSDVITFLGQVSHDQLPAMLQAADIFCRPSRSEGLGNSFLEAMAAGTPIVATPVGGIVDFLTNFETGLQCQSGEPSTIADAFELYMNDANLYKDIQTKGRNLVEQTYQWDHVATAMNTIFETVSLDA